jgi:hypothetical protein
MSAAVVGSGGCECSSLRDLFLDTLQVSFVADGELYAIDPEDLRVGDVILFRNKDEAKFPDKMKYRAIIEAQKIFAERELDLIRREIEIGTREGEFEKYRTRFMDAVNWVHVGVLDENFNVWGIDGKTDVTQRSIRSVIANKECISVRRFKEKVATDDFLRQFRRLILVSSGEKYSKIKILNIFMDIVFPRYWPKDLSASDCIKEFDEFSENIKNDNSESICSQYVSTLLSLAFGEDVLSEYASPLPMHFALSDDLIDVPLHCCRPVLPEPLRRGVLAAG